MKYLFVLITALTFSCSTSQEEEKYTVEDVYSPAGINSEEPTFFNTQDGIGLMWLEKEGEKVTLKHVAHKNSNWTEPKTLVLGSNILANWTDFPGIVTNGTNWIAWYLQISNAENFAYDVMVMQSPNSGETWTEPQKLHSDSTQTEHGFVSAVPSEKGFQLIWLDGRLATEKSPIFTLRSAQIDFEGVISNRKILDENTCTCCQTALLNIGDNQFVALYRDITEDGIRDISAVKYSNTDEQVQPQIIANDNWHIDGCPVNGPRAVMNGEEFGVVWFTMGNDEVAKVKFATSTNSGKSYAAPLLIDANNLGRVDVLARGDIYYVSYLDNAESESELKIAEIKNAKIIHTYTIAKVSSSRKTGFPRMALADYDAGIYITYTDKGINKIAIKFLPFY